MLRSTFSKIVFGLTTLVLIVTLSVVGYLYYLSETLPPLFSINDYKPLLVSDIYARGGEKIGEFFLENRTVIPFEKIPDKLVKAFLASEDGSFFQHKGINPQAIFRALFANIRAGEKVQGASTITQQTARTLFLSSEKTIDRKLKELILTIRMEQNLSKQEILYLYLNQIYLGHGAHGIVSAAETYFRKTVDQLSIAEMAMIAGMPKAPTKFNPVENPKRAKQRQMYVLNRMVEEKFITSDERDVAAKEVIKAHAQKNYKKVGPYMVEAIRQLLVKELGEDKILKEGLKIYTSLDYNKQKAAQESVQVGLREMDKRQGYRGPLKTIDLKDKDAFLKQSRDKLWLEKRETVVVNPDGSTPQPGEFTPLKNTIPSYVNKGEIVEGLVTKVDDQAGLVYVQFAEGQGLIDISDMGWARKPDPDLLYGEHLHIKKPSTALKVGDVIDIKVAGEKFDPTLFNKRNKGKSITPPNFNQYADLSLEQRPLVEGALLSVDIKSGDILAMVGGFDFADTKLNRSYQAKRQTGSSFKPIVYAAGLMKGLTPATPIMGAPIVYGGNEINDKHNMENGADEAWKPGNYDGKFTGDILLRNALKRSLNTPTIRVFEKAGVNMVAELSRRLGIFSPLNMDMSMGLGTSGVTLYEMTKVFSVFANEGKAVTPIMIHKIVAPDGTVLVDNVSFDLKFKDQLKEIEEEFKQKREKELNSPKPAKVVDASEETIPLEPYYFFDSPNQLISPRIAYLITNILRAAVTEAGGTGLKASQVGKIIAGKTGTTNSYFDAWFLGYSPTMTTGVWVGFDHEKSLGKGETGGKAALPIWLEYMKVALKDIPDRDFNIPDGIVFANIDGETGQLASSRSHEVLRQAFIQGTEPKLNSQKNVEQETKEEQEDLYRKDF